LRSLCPHGHGAILAGFRAIAHKGVHPVPGSQPGRFILPFARHVATLPPMLGKATPERLTALSDGVFAVLITVLVLELRPPQAPTYAALLGLWPRWLSYAVTYLFIAIVWVNHHYLMRHARETTARLLWLNFAHLFAMSLLPLSTAWMAVSELAPQPVSFYAAVFFLVNLTYVGLVWDLVGSRAAERPSGHARAILRRRSVLTLVLFGAASGLALRYPLAGLGICIACLILYLKPEPGPARRTE
jgi:uncharacterized membrane protein